MKFREGNCSPIDPSIVKNVIVEAEDMRISTQLSEISCKIINEKLRKNREDQVKRTHLNLGTGQQCVRDFFICLNENIIEWPDVYSKFAFNLKNSTTCPSCNVTNHYETNQTYIELPVPPNNSSLKVYVEKYLNEVLKQKVFCDDGCNREIEKIQRREILNCEEAKFLIIVLSRGQETMTGYEFSKNKINITEDICIR